MPPSRHPEPGFRGARAAWRWVHLTRDDRAHQAMYQAQALESIGSKKYKAQQHRRRLHCRSDNTCCVTKLMAYPHRRLALHLSDG